jgi:hypothetical protein
MAAQPEFGRAVLLREVHNSGVGDDDKGAFGVTEPRVLVHGLTEAPGACERVVARGHDPAWSLAEVTVSHISVITGRLDSCEGALRVENLDDKVVEMDILEEKFGFRERRGLEDVGYSGT